MNSPKVSIIVPVYNVEMYLKRCIESLINQSFKDIEIIIINDGSTDRSIDILNDYSSRDSRIKVINKMNEGISKARNEGIILANGEYMMFVDGDDWIDTNMVEKMYFNIKENKDLVICTYKRAFANKSIPRILNDMPDFKHYTRNEFIEQIYRRLVGPVGEELKNPQYLDCLSTVWAKLYKTSIIKQNNITFISTDEVLGEDTLFNINLFAYIKSCVFINEPLYNYWKGNRSSITTKYREDLKKKTDNLHLHIENILVENKMEHIFYKALNNRRCLSLLGLGLNECSKFNDLSSLQKIRKIKLILEDNTIKRCFRELDLRYFPMHWKIFYFFSKYEISTPVYYMLRCINLLRKYV